MSLSKGDIASAYYTAMRDKDVEELAKYLHSEVQFQSPLSEMKGSDKVLEAAKGFMNVFESLDIKNSFDDGKDAAVCIFDLHCKEPIGVLKAITLMKIEEGMITQMELFFDPTAFKSQ